jgi:hypothetical protein
LGIVFDTEFNAIDAVLKADAKRQKVIDLQNSAKAAGVNYDKISAYSSFASKGLTGYSAEEIAPLASAFGWEEG